MTIDIEQLIREFDEDGNGEIEYDEFMSLLTSGQDTYEWISKYNVEYVLDK